MAKIKVTQIRSVIGRPERQRLTLRSLGIRRMHHTVEVEATPQVMGMIAKVRHLVRIEEQ
ncbi:MAG TPA: 50S ribosomal protein L30 [Bacteroidales bacterium]|nr:50S ribosomal protein L30 [Bacteroidales bacterium]